MKKLIFIFLLLVNICNAQKRFVLLDSISITPTINTSFCKDVYFINNNFYALFGYFKDSVLNILFKDEFNNEYSFENKFKNIFTENSKLFYYNNGFMILKYFEDENIVFFDTISKQMTAKNINIDRNSYMIYPNRRGYFTSSADKYKDYLYYSCISRDIKTKTKNKLHKTLYKKFNTEKQLLEYNTTLNKANERFLNYPKQYKNKLGLAINREISFIVDELKQIMYVSFQGTNDFIKINLQDKSNTNYSLKGMYIDETKMSVPDLTPSIDINRDYYNLLADSYDHLYINDNKIFRNYKLHLNEPDIPQNLIPKKGGKFCPSPNLSLQWAELRLNKNNYLQQFNEKLESELDIAFPKNVNQFIGYKNGNYYFTQKTFLGTRNVNKKTIAKIYTYQLSN